MTFGIFLILILSFGYLIVYLNDRFLNYKIFKLLILPGIFVHELSHAIGCWLTGAKVRDFKVTFTGGQVVHTKSKIPILGSMIISLAPLFFGLFFLELVWYYLSNNGLGLDSAKNIFLNFDFFSWQFGIVLILSLNIGIMLAPSKQDLKNIWPTLIVLFFVKTSELLELGYFAICLLFINLVIITVIIVISQLFGYLTKRSVKS